MRVEEALQWTVFCIVSNNRVERELSFKKLKFNLDSQKRLGRESEFGLNIGFDNKIES